MDLTQLITSFGPFTVSAAMAVWFIRSLHRGDIIWKAHHDQVLETNARLLAQLDTATAEAKQTAADQLHTAREERSEHRQQIAELQRLLAEQEGSP